MEGGGLTNPLLFREIRKLLYRGGISTMRKFFNKIFDRMAVYTIRTDITGLCGVLELLYRDTTLEYERYGLYHSDDKRDIVLKISNHNMDRLIDKLIWKLNGLDLLNVQIYKNDSNVDIMAKERRAREAKIAKGA